MTDASISFQDKYGLSNEQSWILTSLDGATYQHFVFGFGLVQNFNNAATEWYLGYRNYALELNSDAYCVAPIASQAATTPNVAYAPANGIACKINDYNLIVTGLRVKF